ncbi:hypothetical protein Lepto7376_2968 [[Leptolyngbya] sp. PCC 7376]|uniref:hypothetical protein n=1 Tax=[Leptolyngbya] sp. PCC 7376 TaxID=111781 RepID=UPI00029EDA77|nr:hypothetical protein [[Leptolyngbya] sp. PCC 7376]AFY39214.1 hypothetical protein Lepto7376_2968 [[Leptolyngbya] sp. PCC 7376]
MQGKKLHFIVVGLLAATMVLILSIFPDVSFAQKVGVANNYTVTRIDDGPQGQQRVRLTSSSNKKDQTKTAQVGNKERLAVTRKLEGNGDLHIPDFGMYATNQEWICDYKEYQDGYDYVGEFTNCTMTIQIRV